MGLYQLCTAYVVIVAKGFTFRYYTGFVKVCWGLSWNPDTPNRLNVEYTLKE